MSVQKRLLFRATHRGTREADLIIGQFVAQKLKTATQEEEEHLCALVDMEDETLLTCLLHQAIAPIPHPLWEEFKFFAQTFRLPPI